jgi:hypothetical protein
MEERNENILDYKSMVQLQRLRLTVSTTILLSSAGDDLATTALAGLSRSRASFRCTHVQWT